MYYLLVRCWRSPLVYPIFNVRTRSLTLFLEHARGCLQHWLLSKVKFAYCRVWGSQGALQQHINKQYRSAVCNAESALMALFVPVIHSLLNILFTHIDVCMQKHEIKLQHPIMLNIYLCDLIPAFYFWHVLHD